MRKLSVFSLLFLFAFGMSAGFVVGFADEARADIPTCEFACKVEFVCTTETGPLCNNPRFPYYAYRVSQCMGGPLYCPYINEFYGCARGGSKCLPLPIP